MFTYYKFTLSSASTAITDCDSFKSITVKPQQSVDLLRPTKQHVKEPARNSYSKVGWKRSLINLIQLKGLCYFGWIECSEQTVSEISYRVQRRLSKNGLGLMSMRDIYIRDYCDRMFIYYIIVCESYKRLSCFY